MRRVLAGNIAPGYQTPGKAFGPDFVLECEGVTREDEEPGGPAKYVAAE